MKELQKGKRYRYTGPTPQWNTKGVWNRRGTFVHYIIEMKDYLDGRLLTANGGFTFEEGVDDVGAYFRFNPEDFSEVLE